jgi:hypothetical protein
MTLTWPNIVRLGLVQTALGLIVVLTTATINRVMVVELALPAMLPGFLVAIITARSSCARAGVTVRPGRPAHALDRRRRGGAGRRARSARPCRSG